LIFKKLEEKKTLHKAHVSKALTQN